MLDVEFDLKNAKEKQPFFKEIYTPIFGKKNVLSASERSVSQLLDAMRLNDQVTIKSYKTIAKIHTTLDKIFSIQLYAKHLHVLMKNVGGK